MEDTIAAIATAYGEGSIGIIRISGLNAANIMNKIFISVSAQNKEGDFIEISNNDNRRLTYGNIVDPVDNTIIDEVMAVFMKAPATYTREDIAEIQCHGSIVSLKKILSLVLNNGARLAEPGEFTKRAFLNGRIDLSQAEAVIDVIKAKTDKSFQAAINQL
jgi:tRNA modification GTPase